ncbi:hypothetical protein ALC56_05084, partial [Trachymyrmex septentrionalis]
FWCDLIIVLHWLNIPPHLLKTYVANRVVKKIQELTSSNEWRHVRTEDNLVDAISRGQLPLEFSRNRTWFISLSWLMSGDESEWPNETIRIKKIPELKRNAYLIFVNSNFDIFNKFSSYSKELRVIAYCLRVRRPRKYSGPLDTEEINEAEIRVLKLLQANRFENELIRVGGCLRMSNLTSAQKHLILLSSRHRMTDCIIRKAHEKHYHSGIQTTLCILRQKFYIDSFYIKERKSRNKSKIKIYICVFVCLAIKAIHLEIVSDLTSEGFLAAQFKVTFPPVASHFDGLWKSSVKLFKSISSDPNDLLALNFWARWSLEYLKELQKPAKWNMDGLMLNNGDVLIKDKALSCTMDIGQGYGVIQAKTRWYA